MKPNHATDCECDLCMPPCPVCGSKYTEQDQDGHWICLPCTDTTDVSRAILAAPLAAEFDAVLRTYIRPDQYDSAVAANRAETDPYVCHSHDYCDANMAMLEAFERLMHRVPDVEDAPGISTGQDTALWNAAWELWKATAGGAK